MNVSLPLTLQKVLSDQLFLSRAWSIAVLLDLDRSTQKQVVVLAKLVGNVDVIRDEWLGRSMIALSMLGQLKPLLHRVFLSKIARVDAIAVFALSFERFFVHVVLCRGDRACQPTVSSAPIKLIQQSHALVFIVLLLPPSFVSRSFPGCRDCGRRDLDLGLRNHRLWNCNGWLWHGFWNGRRNGTGTAPHSRPQTR